MDPNEKELRLTTLELALEELDKIIAGMKASNKLQEEINEYIKKRHEVFTEIKQVKKS